MINALLILLVLDFIIGVLVGAVIMIVLSMAFTLKEYEDNRRKWSG